MGRPPAIEDGDIQQLLKDRDKIALTTGEIAEELDVHRKTAHKKLKKLEKEGHVDCDEMSQADAWYLADNDPVVLVDGGSWLRQTLKFAFGASLILAISFGFWSVASHLWPSIGFTPELAFLMAGVALIITRTSMLILDSHIPERVESWLRNTHTGKRILGRENA